MTHLHTKCVRFFITKCDSFITKCARYSNIYIYIYAMTHLHTKWVRFFIAKCEVYYKLRQCKHPEAELLTKMSKYTSVAVLMRLCN